MKKIILLLVALICINFFGFGQDDPIGLPQIFPVSPEAASLGKYGEIPINLATGKINYSVPIYTIKVKDYSYPIYLSYNYSGFLAEQDPTMLGLGWDLIASGVITRQVLGLNDERGNNGYIGNTTPINGIGKQYVVPFIKNELNSIDTEWLYRQSSEGKFDTEPDKFVIRANNLQANFYLNEEGIPITVPYKNYKIDFENNLNGKIAVVDENGITYEFEDIENTLVVNSNDNIPQYYKSGWFLKRVKLPNSVGEISFEYTTYQYQKISYSERKTIRTGYIRSGASNVCSNGLPSYLSSENTTTISTKILSKITFPDGYIEFNNTTKDYVSTVNTGGAILNSITISDKYNINYDNYTFTYSDQNPENNRTLTKIERVNNGISIPFYEFEYYGTIPQNVNYTSQDIWGYYNGVNNTNLIDGDRDPSFSSTQIGALKKITYPTKGYTELTYELNQIDPQTTPVSYDDCTDTYFNQIAEISTGSDGSIPYANSNSLTFNIPVNQTVKISLITTTSGFGIAEANALITGNVNNAVCDLGCGSSFASSELELGDHLDENDNYSCYFYLMSGDYTLNVDTFANSNSLASASIKVEYFEESSTIFFEDVGGLRIKETKDFTTPNNSISKNYTYLNEDGTSSGLLLNRPIYTSVTRKETVNTPLLSICVEDFENTTTGSNIPLASFQGSPVLYKRVEMLKNGNDVNGKIVQFFKGSKNAQNSSPFLSWDNKDWRKGLLEKEEIFEKDGTTLKLVQEKVNNYNDFYPYSYVDAIANKKISLSFKAQQWWTKDSDPFYIEYFNTDTGFNLPEFYHLTDTKITSVLNGETVEITTVNSFDQYNGLLKTSQTTGSEGNITETKLYYPVDVENVSSLPGESITPEALKAIDSLKHHNRIAISIQTETIKNGNIFRNRIIYKDWFSKSNSVEHLIEPQVVKTSKGVDILETRLIYHEYDSYGNPSEASKNDGAHLFYVWGYNHSKPIAKIENAKQDDFTADQNNKIAAAITASDNDSSETLENTLRIKLEDLRLAFGNSQVTTYTYDPLIGVTSITDPSDYTSYYVYDDFNRLQYIKDKDSIVLKSYKYHYQGQADPDAIVEYTITSTTNGNGTVTVPATINEGDDLQVSLNPDTGYEITSIKVNNVVQPISTSFTIENVISNLIIDVEFSLISNITVSYVIDGGTNGTVSVSPSVVSYGGSTTVTLTPDSGYQVEYVKVGTTSYTVTNNTATITNITDDIDVHVSFIALSLTVSPTSLSFNFIDGNKTITVTASGPWTVSKSDSWIIISTTTGSGNGTFTVRPLKNLGLLRTGIVTVSNGSTTKLIFIEQMGDEMF